LFEIIYFIISVYNLHSHLENLTNTRSNPATSVQNDLKHVNNIHNSKKTFSSDQDLAKLNNGSENKSSHVEENINERQQQKQQEQPTSTTLDEAESIRRRRLEKLETDPAQSSSSSN
jgi:hypothetical protein